MLKSAAAAQDDASEWGIGYQKIIARSVSGREKSKEFGRRAPSTYKVECPASPKALFKEVPDTPPSNASWDVIPANKPAITKMAADEVPLPRGPLTVVATTARKTPLKLTACTYWTQMESQWGAAGGRDRSRFRTSMRSQRCT